MSRPPEGCGPQSDAVVARASGSTKEIAADSYLLIRPDGAVAWVKDPMQATPFPSMREAARAALRLPAAARAFGLPRQPELALRNLH